MIEKECGYPPGMSEFETTPAEDADRPVTDAEDDLDPEAPSDSTAVNPPRADADRDVTGPEDPDDALQEENAGTSLDQPSDGSS
jgi:hypothetical protein